MHGAGRRLLGRGRDGPEDAQLVALGRDQRILAFAFIALAAASNVVWLVFLYRTWAWLNATLRPEDAPSAARVFWLLLAPIVNFFWAFVATAKLCMLLNEALARRGAKERAPTGLAIVGCFIATWSWALLTPRMPWLVGFVPVIWSLFLRGVARARAALEEAPRSA
jgi:hypothetical protein